LREEYWPLVSSPGQSQALDATTANVKWSSSPSFGTADVACQPLFVPLQQMNPYSPHQQNQLQSLQSNLLCDASHQQPLLHPSQQLCPLDSLPSSQDECVAFDHFKL
jgi:hypothetical protein